MRCHEKFVFEHKESSAHAMSLLGFYLFLIFSFFLKSLSNLFMLLSQETGGSLGPSEKKPVLKRKEYRTQLVVQRGKSRSKRKTWEKALRQEWKMRLGERLVSSKGRWAAAYKQEFLCRVLTLHEGFGCKKHCVPNFSSPGVVHLGCLCWICCRWGWIVLEMDPALHVWFTANLWGDSNCRLRAGSPKLRSSPKGESNPAEWKL